MPSAAELFRFLPEIVLTVMGTLLMVLDAGAAQARARTPSAISASWPCAAIARRDGLRLHRKPGPAFGGMLHGGWLRHVLPRAGDRRSAS